MSYGVDVETLGVRIPVARAHVAAIVRGVLRAEHVEEALISVTFVSTTRIAALNRRHLGHAGSTDVISFSFSRARASDPIVADVYIAPAVARANAALHHLPAREEIARLVVHGVLHALGFDHPEGGERVTSPMWRRQEALLRRVMRSGAAGDKRKRRARAA